MGTGKSQAGLLIELKDPSTRNNELFDSIWSIVERANNLSTHKNQLQRDHITFAEADKPFIRTDKGTVKRRATLALYADYIERFYSTRSEEDLDAVTVDTSSIESIMDSTRDVLSSFLPAIREASPDTDIFSLGLDSLQVFGAVKTIRAAMGLHDQLAPRHLYGNPTLTKFSAALLRLVADTPKKSGTTSEEVVNDDLARMRRLIDEHKARQSIKMNPFDQVNFNHYMGLTFFFSLREGIGFEEAFAGLQKGLSRTMQLIPALEGKIMPCSEQEISYKKGDLRITIPPLQSSASLGSNGMDYAMGPRQLVYKDLSHVLPPFQELRNAGFMPSKIKDELVLGGYAFPQLPADVLIAQANFVEGGCILAANFHHGCFDGIGVMVALRVWAESCRFLQGDVSATCSWLDPESFNHSLPKILYELEGYARPAPEVDPGVWGFLPFAPLQEPPLKELLKNHVNSISNNKSPSLPQKKSLPCAPVFHRRFALPPTPPQDGRYLTTTVFLIPAEKLKKLKQDVISGPEAKGVIPSISDIVQAFFWRAAIKARYRVAKEQRDEEFGPNDISILELPIDGRPYFSSLLPSSYMGSLLILNRPNMLVEMLCSPDTSIGSIAHHLREAAARITPSLVHDAFTLLESLPDYSRFTIANMGLNGHLNAMISNLMLFQTREICFGDGFFGDGGSPVAMRPQIERGRRHFRFLVIYPMKPDGGVELALGTLPEELEMLKSDEELTRYAELVDC